MSYEPVGVVIVGTGLIARFHAQAVNASEKLRLVAVVNPTEGHGDAFAAEFGVPLIRDYDEAISREDVGMVLVATPSWGVSRRTLTEIWSLARATAWLLRPMSLIARSCA